MSGEPATAATVGGYVAAAVVVLGLVGQGIKWLAGWILQREQSRSTKLQAWHDELASREKVIDTAIAQRLATNEALARELSGSNARLLLALERSRAAFHLVEQDLDDRDPRSPVLRVARALAGDAPGLGANLRAAFDSPDQWPPEILALREAVLRVTGPQP